MAQKKLTFLALVAFLLILFVLFLVFFLPDQANGPAGSNVNAVTENQNSTTANSVLDIADVVQNADRYDGASVCIRGVYYSGPETSVLKGERVDANTKTDPLASSVWIGSGVSDDAVTCTGTGGQMQCSGRLTLCGRFHAAPPDGIGFGHLGRYRYQLTEVRNISNPRK